MNIWLLIFILALITFANRYIFFSDAIKYNPGEKLKTFLSFSAQAILTALWVPIVFEYKENGAIEYTNSNYLIATIFVLLLSFYKINMLIVVMLGMALFFALKYNLFHYIF